MRGEAARRTVDKPPLWITPACAGRSLSCARATILIWDHPRVCGEKAVQLICRAPCGGSPPRVRGEGEGAALRIKYARITPACAGRSDLNGLAEVVLKDHPRVCGEKLVTGDEMEIESGSPPRVRGEGPL